jgi:hypothetical protein
VIGANGQISLGKQFAGRQVIVEEREPGVWLIQAASKIASMTWTQVYQDKGLRWEQIESVRSAQDVDAIYSLRITRAARALAYRKREWIRLLLVSADANNKQNQ